MNWRLYEGLYPYCGLFFGWIIRKDPGALTEGSLVTLGPVRKNDISFPTRGNGPIEPGRRTPSNRPHGFYL